MERNGLLVTIGRKRIDFSNGDHVSEHVTQPLRVEEVEIFQSRIFVMQHYAVFVQECRRLET